MAFYQTRRLKFSIATRQSRVDEFLLYTAFFFAANYTITTIILAADLEAKGSGISNTVWYFFFHVFNLLHIFCYCSQ